MEPEGVKAALGDLPNMTLEQGRKLGEFIRKHDLRDCLELGFYHGVSSAYIAAALDEMGQGSLLTIDRCNDEDVSIRDLVPNMGQVLSKLGLKDRVKYIYEPTSYLWRLMRMLEEDRCPRFDFCYIDGAHSWFVDGFAFFLVERLLRPGGWILFDDLDWTYGTSPSLRETDLVRSMPADERDTPQIRKVYELLVKPHPAFDEFREEDDWAFAHKSLSAPGLPAPVRTEVVVRTRVIAHPPSLLNRLAGRVRRMVQRDSHQAQMEDVSR